MKVSDEVSEKLKKLVANLIDLNIKQLENKISKEAAETALKNLIDEHFALEEMSMDIKKFKNKKFGTDNAKQK